LHSIQTTVAGYTE
jgi:hypothetical protein